MSTIQKNKINVSVVVPVYNVDKYLAICLDSLIMQSMQEIEILLINDASTDNSGLICDAYAALDNRIRVLHLPANIKQGRARNAGIEMANGEYIGFIDPDDWIDQDFFEKLYKYAVYKKALVVKGGLKFYKENEELTIKSDLNARIKRGIRYKKPYFSLFTHEHVTAIYKRNFLLNNGIKYADLRNGEDGIFLLQVCYFATKISMVEDAFYYYRVRNDSTVAVKEIEYYKSLLFYFDQYLLFLNSHEMSVQNYRFGFITVLESMRMWYHELYENEAYPDFRKTYLHHVLTTSLQYKGDSRDLIDQFFPSTGIKYHIKHVVRLLLQKMKIINFKFW